MTTPPIVPGPESEAPRPSGPPRGALLTGLLVLGGLWVVLAGRRSALFDLDRHLVPKELALHVTALLAFLLMLPAWRRIRLTLVDLLVAAATVWALISTLLATNRWLAVRSVGISVSALVLYAAGRHLGRSRWSPAVLAGLSTAAVIGAAIGAAQAYGLDLDVLATTRLPGGTFGNRNFMAHLLAIGLPILAVGGLTATSPLTRLMAGAGLVVSLGTIILTRSRASWLGVLVLASVIAFATLVSRGWRQSIHPRAGIVTLGSAILGALLAVLMPNRLSWNSDSPYRDSISNLVDYQSGSGAGRLVQYRNSLQLVPEDPVFGVGPGNWMVHYPRVTTPGDPSYAGWDTLPTNPWPSSDWVAFVTEVGIPGVALLVLAGLAITVTALRRLFVAGEEPGAVILIGTVATAAVVGAFDAVLHLAAPAFFVFLVVGLMLPESGTVMDVALDGRLRRLTISGSLLALVVLAAMSLGQDRAIRVTREDRRAPAVREALRFDPANAKLHLRLAMSGPCTARLRHARIARDLLPYHNAPREALRACGQSS